MQQIFEFDVYTKPNVPLGKLLSLYGNSEMEKYACCFSPAGCIMANYTNIRLEYRGTNQPLDEQLLNTAVARCSRRRWRCRTPRGRARNESQSRLTRYDATD